MRDFKGNADKFPTGGSESFSGVSWPIFQGCSLSYRILHTLTVTATASLSAGLMDAAHSLVCQVGLEGEMTNTSLELGRM